MFGIFYRMHLVEHRKKWISLFLNRYNIFEIVLFKKKNYKKKNLPAQRTKDIIAFIEDFIKNNDEITKYITDKVDYHDYPAYPYIIPFEMSLKRVLHRLETGYYRNEEVPFYYPKILIQIYHFNTK